MAEIMVSGLIHTLVANQPLRPQHLPLDQHSHTAVQLPYWSALAKSSQTATSVSHRITRLPTTPYAL